ncbi:MAG: hypothetical protein Q7O66_16825 [Dehalococcoidia bacterium]|nr:hypothetical protein [Dehalococcoidia bacterium]
MRSRQAPREEKKMLNVSSLPQSPTKHNTVEDLRISAASLAKLALMRDQLMLLAHCGRVRSYIDRELLRDAASLIRAVIQETLLGGVAERDRAEAEDLDYGLMEEAEMMEAE